MLRLVSLLHFLPFPSPRGSGGIAFGIGMMYADKIMVSIRGRKSTGLHNGAAGCVADPLGLGHRDAFSFLG